MFLYFVPARETDFEKLFLELECQGSLQGLRPVLRVPLAEEHLQCPNPRPEGRRSVVRVRLSAAHRHRRRRQQEVRPGEQTRLRRPASRQEDQNLSTSRPRFQEQGKCSVFEILSFGNLFFCNKEMPFSEFDV